MISSFLGCAVREKRVGFGVDRIRRVLFRWLRRKSGGCWGVRYSMVFGFIGGKFASVDWSDRDRLV